MAKTAINIDRDLADRAGELLGTETLTATVEEALREVVARAERKAAFQWFRDHPFTPEERELMNRASR
ncbi:MAG TPA: type II toxin-antitoxin system VapB family antitoxin [Acidimicrobiales bacterium]|nr:type II toxin-antitoxin system VapB family antitoxin [Acidimicrobiales bacterium]